jgi:hypothetical protein
MLFGSYWPIKRCLTKMMRASVSLLSVSKVYRGDWYSYYDVCDLHVVTLGAKAGVNEVPDEELEPKKVGHLFGKYGSHFEHPWHYDRSQGKFEAQDLFNHQGLAYYEEIRPLP